MKEKRRKTYFRQKHMFQNQTCLKCSFWTTSNDSMVHRLDIIRSLNVLFDHRAKIHENAIESTHKHAMIYVCTKTQSKVSGSFNFEVVFLVLTHFFHVMIDSTFELLGISPRMWNGFRMNAS